MNHASTDTNNDGVIESEYGDNGDLMGGTGSFKRFHAIHRLQLGWFSTANVVTDPVGPLSIYSSSIVGSGAYGTALIKLTMPWEATAFWVSP